MIDNELKNRLLEIYRRTYRRASLGENSFQVDFNYGELVGIVKVLTELKLASEMTGIRQEVDLESGND